MPLIPTFIPFITEKQEEVKSLNDKLGDQFPSLHLTGLDEDCPSKPPLAIIDGRMLKAQKVLEAFALAGIPTIIFGNNESLRNSGVLQVEDADALPVIIESFVTE